MNEIVLPFAGGLAMMLVSNAGLVRTWLSGALLDRVNAAALDLTAAVTWQIGSASLVDVITALTALAALVLLLRFKVNSTWLIAGGVLIGLASALLR